ncbi:MAG: peptidoglycan-binding protein [Candidatus Pacebacteria bacterium]|nr:peptidoglycan-binding protein [Candidatus Paceibacterota bacterium]
MNFLKIHVVWMVKFLPSILIISLAIGFVLPAQKVRAAEDLVGYWKFNEGTGTTATDSSAYGNNGTLTGSGVTYSNVRVAPISASNPYSLLFDGTSGTGVSVPDNNSLDISSSLTAMAWIYWDGTSAEDNVIFDKSNAPGGDTPNYRLILKGDGRLGLWNGSSAGYSTGTTVQPNEWTLVNFTIESGVTSFYINGVAAGTANIGVGAVTSYNLFIGRDAIGRYFHGYIDEARLYNRSLTPEEILTIADGGAGPGVPEEFNGCSTVLEKRGRITYSKKCGEETIYSIDPELLPAVTRVDSSGLPLSTPISVLVSSTTSPILVVATTSTSTIAVVGATVGFSSSSTPVISSATSTVNPYISTNETSVNQKAFLRDMRYKDENPDVLMLQRLLAAQGFLAATPNGYFGRATKAAVMKFQRTHSLPASGFFGPMSRAVANL